MRANDQETGDPKNIWQGTGCKWHHAYRETMCQIIFGQGEPVHIGTHIITVSSFTLNGGNFSEFTRQPENVK